MSILTELKRRGVSRVVAAYAIVAWLLIQIVVSVEEPLGLPPWSDTLVIIALIIGFPICAILAWVYDITDRGLERTADVSEEAHAHRAALSRSDVWTLIVATAGTVFVFATAGYILASNVGRTIETIAILPFELETPNADTAYLGEGMRDALILRMSRLDDLRIRTTSSDGAETTEPEALSDLLSADAIARGTITQLGDSIEVSAELVSADGAILWRDQFSTESTRLLDIEGAICVEMANRLGRQISAAEELELMREPTSNPAAHRLYQQGRYYWNRRTADAFIESIDYFNRAIDLDPNFALAYAGLADTYLMLLGWGIQPPEEVADLIVMAAQQAIARDPTIAQPHAALGYFKTMYERDWDSAREDFLTAIELDSNYSSAHQWYAFLLMTEGNMSAALEEILLARASEPLSPIINAEVGYFFLFDRQYQRALAELEAAALLDPNYPSTVSYLARTHTLLGQLDQAREYINRWQELDTENLIVTAYGAMTLPMAGLTDEARGIYARALAASDDIYVMPGILGALAATIGDYDAAFRHFDDGLEDRTLIASWLRDPLLDGMRSDPRYGELMQRIGVIP